MIRYYTFAQRSKIWFKYKAGKWSGSTAIELLKGKTAPPQSDSTYDNRYMLRGRVLEPLAIEAYERKYNTAVSHFGFITNSKYPHAGYSPDGIEEGIVDEVKCVNLEKHNAIIGGEMPIPIEWRAQIQFGLLITELTKAKLILYNPDSDTPLAVIDIMSEAPVQVNLIARLEETRPKQRVSSTRAKQKYVANNTIKIKEKRHERYMRSKAMLQ